MSNIPPKHKNEQNTPKNLKMIEISPKPKKLLNDLENLENYKKWPQNLKVNETPLKPKKLVAFPQNLQND